MHETILVLGPFGVYLIPNPSATISSAKWSFLCPSSWCWRLWAEGKRKRGHVQAAIPVCKASVWRRIRITRKESWYKNRTHPVKVGRKAKMKMKRARISYCAKPEPKQGKPPKQKPNDSSIVMSSAGKHRNRFFEVCLPAEHHPSSVVYLTCWLIPIPALPKQLICRNSFLAYQSSTSKMIIPSQPAGTIPPITHYTPTVAVRLRTYTA